MHSEKPSLHHEIQNKDAPNSYNCNVGVGLHHDACYQQRLRTLTYKNLAIEIIQDNIAPFTGLILGYRFWNRITPSNENRLVLYIVCGTLGSVVVKALRYKSESPGIDSRCRWGFSVASYSSMCPEVDSASKNEYQVNPGGKGGRCVRLTTYHPHVPMSRNLGALTSWNTVGLFRPVMGQLYLYLYILCSENVCVL
jgi:hypothetical protein